MAKTRSNAPAGAPKSDAIELAKLNLQAEVARTKAAQTLQKAAEALPLAVVAMDKAKEALDTKLGKLTENFKLKSVEILKEITDLEKEKTDAEDSLIKREKELGDELTNLEKQYDKDLKQLTDIHTKAIADADYEYQKQIREKGETAFKKFLTDRNLDTIDKVEHKDLLNYKNQTAADIKSNLDKAVQDAKDEKDIEFQHTNDLAILTHKSEVDLLNAQITSHNAIVGKLEGMLKHYSKKDESLLNEVKQIVESAARGVQNNINQNPNSK